MKCLQRLLTCIVVVLTFVQTPLAYAAEVATPSATPEMSNAPEATPSMVLDRLMATDSASVSSPAAAMITPSPTLEMLTGPSGVFTPSASVKLPPRIRPLTKRAFRAGEVATVVVENSDLSAIKASVKNNTGDVVDTTPSLEPYDGGIRVTFIPKTSAKPGKYTIVVEDTTTGVTTTQDFLWGVLAFNTDAATYNPGDIATIALAVLDEEGKMVCNADVTLTILSPARNITTLKTADGTIRVTQACSVHEYTMIPDYETSYQTSDEGVYQAMLSATTTNGTYAIQDSFQVSSDMPFGVKRGSATRIYPPKPYPMTIDVTANEDFSGTVTETVPENFTITPLEGSVPYTDVKIIVPIPESQTPIQLGMPFDGNYPVTLGFGDRIKDPQIKNLYEQNELQGHDGADFAMPVGTVVLAVDSGTVSRIADNPYGTTVVIDHSWGRSYYGHLSAVQVKVGDTVSKGAPIALSGNTGLTTGAHLHFGMKLSKNDIGNGYYGKIDPMPYLTSSVVYQADGQGKQISWNVDIKTGEKIKLGYTYKAPNVSPQFYLLGPLTFRSSAGTAPTTAPLSDSPFVLGVATDSAKPSIPVSNSITYQEPRRWQIAADATVTYVNASTPGTDAGGAFTVTGAAPAAAGNIIILQVLQDGTTNGAVTQTSATNITALDGTANTWTAITEQTVGASDEARQYLWIGRSISTSAPTFTGGNSTSEDVYFRMYEFSGVSKGTTLATVLENATAGTVTNGAGTSTSVLDTSVQTLGADRLALNFIGYNDEVPAAELTAMTGETGGDWTYPVAAYGSASGTDGGVALVTAAMASAGTIDGGSDAITSYAWGVIGFALIPEFTPTVSLTTPTDTQTISDTTPDLVFTGTDGNSDEIEYNVQVDTVNTFDSVVNGFDLKYVDLWLIKHSSPTDNLTVEVRSTIGGTALGTSNTVASSSVDGTGAYVRFTFTTPVPLSVSTKYYLVLKRSGARDTTNFVSWQYNSPSDYGGGGKYTNDSNVWSSESSTEDCRFIVYDINTVAVVANDTSSAASTQLYGGTGSLQELGQSFTASVTSPLLDINSVDNSGFSGTGNPHPWPSGNAVTYTVQSALPNDTYYWRVRGLDPLGSNTWGAWSSPTWSFTVGSGGPTLDQLMRHGKWFNSSGVRQGFTF